ncbi:hypothetical protein JXA84_08330 [candidate division WOR-3 bacterium]|nr:hypothetical protein [candidate division WOR-3 bacterium]
MKVLFSLATAAISALSLNSSMIEFKSIEIDFTDSTDVLEKAQWYPQGTLNITEEGLGWDGESASSRDCRIITEPLALGLSWRPPSSISVKVTIQPEPESFVLNSGDTSTPYYGDVYVRYSPDLLNWSSWQVLQVSERENPGRFFCGIVRVPNLERETYSALISEYGKFDVAWRCDEDAAVRWLLSIDEHFFERYIPFIGYVEFLFESSVFGGQRISSFEAEIIYSISGLHTLPKDMSSYEERNSTPWSFRAEQSLR